MSLKWHKGSKAGTLHIVFLLHLVASAPFYYLYTTENSLNSEPWLEVTLKADARSSIHPASYCSSALSRIYDIYTAMTESSALRPGVGLRGAPVGNSNLRSLK